MADRDRDEPETVLLKGATMKTHIIIHAGNLLHNLRLFSRRTRSPVMFVVKANAYGHGLRQVVEITRESPAVGHYAVDSLAEALTVRALQKRKPVLVLGWRRPFRRAPALAVERCGQVEAQGPGPCEDRDRDQPPGA